MSKIALTSVGAASIASAVALTPKTLEAAAVSTFVLGWVNAVAVSCLQ